MDKTITYTYNGTTFKNIGGVVQALRKDNPAFTMPTTNEGWEALGVSMEIKGNTVSLLDQAKQKKLSEIEKAFDEKRHSKTIYVKSSLGFSANANETSIINLSGMISYMEHTQAETMQFKAFDNTYKALTLADMKTLHAELALEGSLFYQYKWQLVEQVNTATNLEEVSTVEAVFPDTIALP